MLEQENVQASGFHQDSTGNVYVVHVIDASDGR